MMSAIENFIRASYHAMPEADRVSPEELEERLAKIKTQSLDEFISTTINTVDMETMTSIHTQFAAGASATEVIMDTLNDTRGIKLDLADVEKFSQDMRSDAQFSTATAATKWKLRIAQICALDQQIINGRLHMLVSQLDNGYFDTMSVFNRIAYGYDLMHEDVGDDDTEAATPPSNENMERLWKEFNGFRAL